MPVADLLFATEDRATCMRPSRGGRCVWNITTQNKNCWPAAKRECFDLGGPWLWSQQRGSAGRSCFRRPVTASRMLRAMATNHLTAQMVSAGLSRLIMSDGGRSIDIFMEEAGGMSQSIYRIRSETGEPGRPSVTTDGPSH